MKTSALSSRFLVSLILFSLSYLSSAQQDANYTSFVQCLSKNGVTNEDIASIVLNPQNGSFTSVLHTYAKNLWFQTPSTLKPIIIVTAKSDPHVQKSVICTKELGIQLKTRSDGHDYDGRSYVSNHTFLILDMFNMRQIDVFLDKGTAVVQVGATLGEVYFNIWNKSKGYLGKYTPHLVNRMEYIWKIQR